MEACRLLSVRFEGDVLYAALPHGRLLGQEFEDDCRRLSGCGAPVVRLDLRTVEIIDGDFFVPVLRLAKSLGEAGARLDVVLSADLAEVCRITRLDRLLRITGPDGSPTTDGAGHGP